MNDHSTNGDGGGDGGGFDDEEQTAIDDFSAKVATQLGQAICAVAGHLGRYGDGLGGLGAVIDGDSNATRRAERLTTAHAHGMNAARYLRESLEHVTAANELLGKAASKARAIAQR